MHRGAFQSTTVHPRAPRCTPAAPGGLAKPPCMCVTPAQSPARKPAGATHAAGRKRPGRPKAASAQTADRRKRQAAQTADRELILLACEFEPAKCMMRPNACNARVQASLSSARMPGLNTQGSHAEAFLDRPGFDRPPENENALQATAIYCDLQDVTPVRMMHGSHRVCVL